MSEALQQPRPLALVTGASRGIGQAIAIALGRDGYRVAVNFRDDQRSAEGTQRAIRDAGGESLLCQFDVSQSHQVRDSIKQLNREIGRIDVLVNNAGIIRDQPLVRMPDDDWHAVLRVNLEAAFYCCRAVVKTWTGKNCGRRIVNISSVIGEMGAAYQTNYSATKAGLLGFTKSLARELAPKRVTVNAITPGFIVTDATAHLDPSELISKIPLGRFGQPEDVANAVSMLVAPGADFITGQIIRIDGGLYT